MISAVFLLSGLSLALGWLLLLAHRQFQDDDSALVDAIDALLPQTQCAQCGYPGCRPYAEAVAGGAAIDLCPPGGRATFEALRALLHQSEGIAPPPPEAALARIREQDCIGCFLCIRVCPVDAIIGAPGFMHTVIEQECTGCELCLPACPVDCIELIPTTDGNGTSTVPSNGRPTATNGTPTVAEALIPKRDTHPKANKGHPPKNPNKGHPPKTGHPSTPKTPKKGHPPQKRTPSPGAETHSRKGHPPQYRDPQKGHPPRHSAPPTPSLGTQTSTKRTLPAQPCIGCNRCEPVCPAHLAPRELLWLSAAGKWNTATHLGLARCIECRLCDRACPSDIPLARIFGEGKRVLADLAAKRAQAAHAKTRFDARAARLAAAQSEARARRAQRLARRKRLAEPGSR